MNVMTSINNISKEQVFVFCRRVAAGLALVPIITCKEIHDILHVKGRHVQQTIKPKSHHKPVTHPFHTYRVVLSQLGAAIFFSMCCDTFSNDQQTRIFKWNLDDSMRPKKVCMSCEYLLFPLFF